ncbi:siderophore-interacting protein [Tessaracoccus sp. OS52]|uniref:siderophore-interacting protein n=1 Tax=Tessaracoccus sp. OS52 TaxID=2886691 RepID=UPI001D0FB818|nr:siderophore-interacting protein [Tessaracoccus sp. OS52]
MSQPNARPAKPQTVLEVLRTERLGPHMVRVYLGGSGFAQFRNNDFTDKYVKILFADPSLGLEPPYDLARLREQLQPGQLPVTRTYTVRKVDVEQGWICLDFVVHGDEGIAGPWAVRAQPGERVCFTGPGGAYAPEPDADWYLFTGDESALPAISAALEALPADAVGDAFIEVTGADDELALTAPPGLNLHWLHRGAAEPGTSTVLVDAVADFSWRPGRVQVFAHGERESVKAQRDVFFVTHGLERSQVSISGYWAYGRTEDRFQAEKREPVGQILEP